MAAKGKVTPNGIEGIGDTELELAGIFFNNANAQPGHAIEKELINGTRDVIKGNERYVAANHAADDKPVLMNSVNANNEAAYVKAKQLFEYMRNEPNGSIENKINELGIKSQDFKQDFGHAYLDYASAGIARGDISSKSAAQGYEHMVNKFSPEMASMNSNVIRTHVVLWPEHYQYLDPNTRDQMDPALRLRAAQDIARLETIAGASLVDKDGQLRTTLENDLKADEKWPDGHESAITKNMALQNKQLEAKLTAEAQADKIMKPEKNATAHASSGAEPKKSASVEPKQEDHRHIASAEKHISHEAAIAAKEQLANMSQSGVKPAGLPTGAATPEMGQSSPPAAAATPANGAAVSK